MNNFELTAINGLLSLRDHNSLTPPYTSFMKSPISSPIVPLTPEPQYKQTSGSSRCSDSSSSSTDLKYHEHLIPKRKKPMNSVSLPPISDLLTQCPMIHSRNGKISFHGTRNSAFSQFTRAVPYHPYSRRQLISSPVPTSTTTTFDRRVVEVQTTSASPARHIHQHSNQHHSDTQGRKQLNNPSAILQYSQQLQSKILLLAQEHHRLMIAIQPLGRSELSAFFQGLRQIYGEEFERDLLQSLQENMDTNEDDNSEDSDNSLNKQRIRKFLSKKTPSTANDKPRWTMSEKAELFEAIIKDKKLDLMSSFDWAKIGVDCGKQDKACKDQWRRGVLKMLRDTFIETL